jgi:hypothetical protein
VNDPASIGVVSEGGAADGTSISIWARILAFAMDRSAGSHLEPIPVVDRNATK